MYMTERHNGTDKYIAYAARLLRKKELVHQHYCLFVCYISLRETIL